MIPIKAHAPFHPLKHCIVGQSHSADTMIELLGDAARDDEICLVMEHTEKELSSLVTALRSMGVTCYRPVLDTGNAFDRPPISPRDYFGVIGETLLIGKLVNGYKEILSSVDRKSCRWYLDSDISSANMIRCGNHVHWDIDPRMTTDKEEEIKSWLHQNGYRLSVTRMGWHVDGAYSIVKPGVIVASRDLCGRWLSDIYPGWDILFLDRHNDDPPYARAIATMRNRLPHWLGDYEESNYDVNLLSVDEQHCVVPSDNKILLDFLGRHKIEPIICEFKTKQFWDNGIHCMTQDLYREGDMEDYF